MNCLCHPGFFKTFPTHLVDKLCASDGLSELRKLALINVHGSVLEIGIGSGHNLVAYPWGKITSFHGLEPSKAMLEQARENAWNFCRDIELIEGVCESIPLADSTLDTIVITFTLCSIKNAEKSLAEIRRVLKPGGKLVFLEHQHESDRLGRHLFQSAITPLWKRIADGCDLTNQPVKKLIHAGFSVQVAGKKSMVGAEWPMGECVWGHAHIAENHHESI